MYQYFVSQCVTVLNAHIFQVQVARSDQLVTRAPREDWQDTRTTGAGFARKDRQPNLAPSRGGLLYCNYCSRWAPGAEGVEMGGGAV